MRTVPDRLPSAIAAVLVGWAAASPSPALVGWAAASPASIVPTDPEDGFVRLPLDLYAFADGLHVRSAPSSLSHIVGARLVAVGEVATNEALARVGVVAHGDNPMTRRLLAPRLLTVPAVLRARGLVDGHGAVPLRLETTEGAMVVARVRPRAMADTLDTDVLDTLRGHLPRWLDDRDRRYWFEALPGSRAV